MALDRIPPLAIDRGTRFTPRLAYRVLVPASELIFLLGLLVSGTILFRDKKEG